MTALQLSQTTCCAEPRAAVVHEHEDKLAQGLARLLVRLVLASMDKRSTDKPMKALFLHAMHCRDRNCQVSGDHAAARSSDESDLIVSGLLLRLCCDV